MTQQVEAKSDRSIATSDHAQVFISEHERLQDAYIPS
jgi:hypothetical protein